MVIIFVDIWVSFGATWVVGIQGEQRMQNNQKVLFLDSKIQKKMMSSFLFVKHCPHRTKFSCGLKICEPNEPIKSEIYTYFDLTKIIVKKLNIIESMNHPRWGAYNLLSDELKEICQAELITS